MVDDPENPEPQDKKVDPFDIDDTGEVAGYISLDQARVLAMQAATKEPGVYGDEFHGVLMAFTVETEEDTEDHYVITLSFRPQGRYSGASGQEQFFIEKEGIVAHRQVLDLPMAERRRRFPTTIVLVIIGLLAFGGAAGGVIASGALNGNGGDIIDMPTNPPNPPLAAIQPFPDTPTPTVTPTIMPAPTATQVAQATAVPSPTPTGTPTISPSATPIPTEVPTLPPPTRTATPIPDTSTPTRTGTPTPSPSRTQTATPAPAASPTPTATLTLLTGVITPATTIPRMVSDFRTPIPTPPLTVAVRTPTPTPFEPTFFTLGSHKDDVIRVQGTPSAVSVRSFLDQETWDYEFSTVTFKLSTGRVTEWRDSSGVLKVQMTSK